MPTLDAPSLADYWPTFETLLLILVGLVLGLVGKSFLPSYFSEKGRNLATKEDIQQITQLIEGVKTEHNQRLQALAHENQLMIEALRTHTQRSLVAAERRLEAHQAAFALWRKLVRNMHEDTMQKVVQECEAWWNQNCLYLDAEARQGFSDAYWRAHDHPVLLRDRSNPAAVTENWSKIIKAGDQIISSVQLPPLGEREAKDVSDSLPKA